MSPSSVIRVHNRGHRGSQLLTRGNTRFDRAGRPQRADLELRRTFVKSRRQRESSGCRRRARMSVKSRVVVVGTSTKTPQTQGEVVMVENKTVEGRARLHRWISVPFLGVMLGFAGAVAAPACLLPHSPRTVSSHVHVAKTADTPTPIPRRPKAAPSIDVRRLTIGRQVIPHSLEPERSVGEVPVQPTVGSTGGVMLRQMP